VLKDGELVEQGTHEALVELGGLYSELFQVQAAGYRSWQVVSRQSSVVSRQVVSLQSFQASKHEAAATKVAARQTVLRTADVLHFNGLTWVVGMVERCSVAQPRSAEQRFQSLLNGADGGPDPGAEGWRVGGTGDPPGTGGDRRIVFGIVPAAGSRVPLDQDSVARRGLSVNKVAADQTVGPRSNRLK
jgi:hypothetical protein